MRLRQLKKVLETVVLAGLPATVGACFLDGDPDDLCFDRVARDLKVQMPADPPMQFRIDSCRVDVDACNALCALVMQRAEPAGTAALLSQASHTQASLPAIAFTCEVEFRGDVAAIHVAYEIPLDGPGCPVEGRRPHGLARPERLDAGSAAGAWLAQAAWLEAASVHAFTRLAHELARHGAPRALVQGAVASVGDELRHTAAMTRLAARFGAAPPTPEVAGFVERPLEALALENAVEGCVRETWGAALALWQAHNAADAEVRAAFRAIASDELRHAALAWAIDRWASPRLDDAARARVAAARELAARELLHEAGAPALPVLGIPGGAALRGLVARTHAALWKGGRS